MSNQTTITTDSSIAEMWGRNRYSSIGTIDVSTWRKGGMAPLVDIEVRSPRQPHDAPVRIAIPPYTARELGETLIAAADADDA